jgi:hypothetical protein
MLRTTTVIHCDRCSKEMGQAEPGDPRTSARSSTEPRPDDGVRPAALTIDDQLLRGQKGGRFEDLCSPCRLTVSNCLDRIFRRKVEPPKLVPEQ